MTFLTAEHGFTPFEHEPEIQNPGVYLSFGFQNEDLDLWVENERGCFDCILRLKKEVPWLRPYMSRMFSLHEIVRHVSPGETDRLGARLEGLSPEEECRAMLETYSRWLKEHAAPILSGDCAILEEINRSRRPR